jgi:hypothetical protein
MKVVCIDNTITNRNGHYCFRLTIGKVYDDINEEITPYNYRIKNDAGDCFTYSKKLFISLKEYRKQKLLKIVGTNGYKCRR